MHDSRKLIGDESKQEIFNENSPNHSRHILPALHNLSGNHNNPLCYPFPNRNRRVANPHN
jgi:hypothetical protein